MADSAQVGDIGTKIILSTVENISTATAQKIMYTKPDGVTTGEWVATLESTTSISYITLEDDLDQAGDWCLQAYVNLNDVWVGRGERYCLDVQKNCG